METNFKAFITRVVLFQKEEAHDVSIGVVFWSGITTVIGLLILTLNS